MTESYRYRTALVLSGGGTRGAYEAGVLHYIRTMLPTELRRGLRFHIHCGSSVGAINTAFLAATAHDREAQGNEIVRLWKALRTDDIYRRGPATLGKLLFRSVLGIASHLLGIKGLAEPNDAGLHFQGLFDTQPFFHFLRQQCHWGNISKNVESGEIEALAISATNMQTGQPELFLQKHPGLIHSERILIRLEKITPRHVMASAALPLLFPPVPIHNVYYNDGSLRQNTPLGPAVALGAARILIVGTRYRRTSVAPSNPDERALPPTLGEVLGRLFNAMLLDRLDYDRDQLDRVNRILVAAKNHVDPETYRTICNQAAVQQIETLSIFPSLDIANLADETVRSSYHRPKTIGIFERAILRIVEADTTRGSELLSYFLFEPAYISKLIELGFEDARGKHDALVAFAERAIAEKPVE